MTSLRATVSLCILFVALVLGLFYFSVTRTHHLSAEELRERGVFLLPQPRELSPFELTAHTGRSFTRVDLAGQWQFLFFGFTHCPDICPVSMAALGQAERELREAGETPFRGILVTVDPERDDAAALRRYVQAFSPTFVGVTGEPEALAGFGAELHVAFAKVPDGSGGYSVDHSGNIVVINPKGHYHGFIKQPHRADLIVDAYRSMQALF